MATQTPPGGASPQDFFAAQRRHRRAARAYSTLATFVVVAQSVPAAVMISPLAIGLLVLTTDLASLVRPVPDLVRITQDRLGHRPVATVDGLLAVLVVVAPGCLLVASTSCCVGGSAPPSARSPIGTPTPGTRRSTSW